MIFHGYRAIHRPAFYASLSLSLSLSRDRQLIALARPLDDEVRILDVITLLLP